MKNHERNFKFFFGVVLGGIVLVWLGILAFWTVVGVATFNVIQDPSIIGKTVGQAVGGYNATIDDYKKKADDYKEQLEKRTK